MSYSQSNEEEVILRYFGERKGRFLDIGAGDGVHYSNTRALVQRGWEGVMVEPNPMNLVGLLTNVRAYADKITVFATAVASQRTVARMLLDDANNDLCTIRLDNTYKISQLSPVQFMVPTITPADLVRFGPYEFISIDAEGLDMDILKSFPTLEGTELLCIEPFYEAGMAEMKAYLPTLGFTNILLQNMENLIVSR